MSISIYSVPDTTAYPALQYLYQPVAQGSGVVTSWSLDGSLATGMNFNPGDGVVSWVPTYDQTGAGPFTLTVHADTSDSQTFSLVVGTRPVRVDLNESLRTQVGPYGAYNEQIVWQIDPNTNNLIGFKRTIS